MPALSVNEISSSIIGKLGITAPGLSLAIGTPERKIIDAAAEAIFENKVDGYLVAPQLDLDSRSGTDLEDYVGVFAFGRVQGTYATGSVTFTLTIPAVQPVLIPYGTQVFKPGDLNNPSISFTTTSSTTINIGQQVATLPVQASLIGTAGNVTGGSVTGFSSGLGIGTCNNSEAFTGGTNDETDDELRARFKATFLRNIAGTVDFYTGLSTQAVDVRRVNILGPTTKFDAQVETAAAASPVNVPAKNCQFVWPQSYSVSVDKGLPAQSWFTDVTDYTMTTGAISYPVLTPGAACANKFLDISYEYTSTNSRNDPLRGIANKIDIYVDGSAPTQITEKVYIKTRTMSADPNSVDYTGNFVSYPSGASFTAATKYQRLGSTPILEYPTTIVVGSTTYDLDTDYKGLRDITLNQGSERETSGIFWLTTPPADNTYAMITYIYNQIPEVLNGLIRKSKQITSDPLVHAAEVKSLAVYLVVQYDRGASAAEVQPRVKAALSVYFSSLSFGAWIQLSDIVTYVHNVRGIDNCRMAVSADGAPASIVEMEGSSLTAVTHDSDYQLEDNQIPTLGAVTLYRRSFNTFS